MFIVLMKKELQNRQELLHEGYVRNVLLPESKSDGRVKREKEHKDLKLPIA